MEELKFQEELIVKEKEIKEKERIRIRAEERVKRRELRFEEYIDTERKHMVYEDSRSYQVILVIVVVIVIVVVVVVVVIVIVYTIHTYTYLYNIYIYSNTLSHLHTLPYLQHRDYEWQLLHEQSEREDMFNEYNEQTQYDRYWGIDIYTTYQYQEEQRLRKAYQQKIIELNQTMIQINSIKPNKKKLNLLKIGSLPIDNEYSNETERREAVIRKLKAEEIRSKLHTRVSFSYN